MSVAVKLALQSPGRTRSLASLLAIRLVGAGYFVLFELLISPDPGKFLGDDGKGDVCRGRMTLNGFQAHDRLLCLKSYGFVTTNSSQ